MGEEIVTEAVSTEKRSRAGIYATVAVVVIILLLVLISYHPASSEPNTMTVSVNKTVMVSVPSQATIEGYDNITNRSYDEKLSLTGHLKEGLIIQNDGSKLIYKYLVDDSGRKIRVGLYNSKMDYLFANTSNMSNVSSLPIYNATGRLYFWQNILLLEVSSIMPVQNITRDIPKTTIVNETITDYTPRAASFDLEKGIRRIFR